VLALAVIAVPVAMAAYLIPAHTYVAEWGTSKCFGARYLGYCLASVAAFSAACWAVRLAASRWEDSEPERDWRDEVPWAAVLRVFDWTAALCIAAYLAWAAVAISRGADLAQAAAVFAGSKGAAARMKEVYLVTIPGVTTLTQLGIATIVLGFLASARFPARRVAPAMAVVMGLALLRSVLNSERLALIELALPGVIIASRVLVLPTHRWWLSRSALAAAPVVGFVAVFSLFAGLEYVRSWANFYSGAGEDFWNFAATRFAGYYATALNNGAFLAERLAPLDVPYFSLPFLWKFPVLKELSEGAFPDLLLHRTSAMNDVLARGANPEFNNGGGLLLPLVDLGLPGLLLFWSGMGCLAGVSFESFRSKRLAGLLTYPILYTGLVEAPRVIYSTDGRVFPVWCAVGCLWVAARLIAWRGSGSDGATEKWRIA
jgi:hypothetical protein